MVKVLQGNLFETKMQTIVNTVNCVGVMGKGIALEAKKQFPDMYKDYIRICNKNELKLGRPYLYRRLIPPNILIFPTKDHWRSVARIRDIEEGLQYLLSNYKQWGITSMAVPPLGCGEGQLEWRVVGRTLYRYLSKMDIPIELYAPHGTPIFEMQISFLSHFNKNEFTISTPSPSRIEPGLLGLVEILNRIEREPYHWPIGRTTFQKIAYFATELGLPTGLSFSKGSYGPYSTLLKKQLTKLVNNGLIDEEPIGSNMFLVKTGSTYEDAKKSYKEELACYSEQIDKIYDLFLRVKLTKNAEIAATIHYSAKTLSKEINDLPSEHQIFDYVIDWKKNRRPPINRTVLADTIRTLAILGWVDVKPSNDLPVSVEDC